MEYGSDYFDKNSSLLSESNGSDNESDKSSSANSNSDYADKTQEKAVSSEDRYDEIFDSTKRNTRTFSVVSLLLSVVALFCSFVGPLGFILGLLAVGFALLSRKILGYFDGICIFGLIVGIFASSFGLVVFLLSVFTDVFDAIKNLF